MHCANGSFWVAYNQFMNVSGHAFGWYCLFVALTAIPAGIYSFANADGNDASIYLRIDWFAWAVLWFLFFVLLALGRPIARLTGYVRSSRGSARRGSSRSCCWRRSWCSDSPVPGPWSAVGG